MLTDSGKIDKLLGCNHVWLLQTNQHEELGCSPLRFDILAVAMRYSANAMVHLFYLFYRRSIQPSEQCEV